MSILAEPPARWRTDHVFFVGMATAILLSNIVGFTVLFFKTDLAKELHSTWVKVHVFLFASWLLLFFTQTVLIASHKPHLHRRVGIASVFLAGSMLVITIISGIAGFMQSPARPVIEYWMLYVLVHVDMFDFAILTTAGLVLRASEGHKRLMFLATVTVGIRFPFAGRFAGIDLPHYFDQGLFLLAGVLYDLVTRGRINRAYVWGGLVILIMPPAADWIFRTMVPHLVAVPK